MGLKGGVYLTPVNGIGYFSSLLYIPGILDELTMVKVDFSPGNSHDD